MAKRIVRGRKSVQIRNEREGTWTQAKREAFLGHLAVTLNVRASCRAVGMSEQGLYKLKRRDPEFRNDFGHAVAEAYERMELRYLERGTYGTKRPVFQGGKKVGEIVEYPDKVAMTLLRAHRETAIRARDEDRARREEIELAKLRLAERLSGMNRRMGGDG